MGANHVRVLQELDGFTLVAVVDPDEARRGRAAAARPVATFGSTAAMLAETQPDFVSVVVPTGLHVEVALAVIESGAHVLVEKPIAATFDGAVAVATAAERARVLLSVGHIERFNPAIRELRARLDAGQGGRVLQVHARRVGPFPHRIRDVGVIHDLAPHDIDVMRYLLGREVERVYAEARQHINTDNEDLFAGMLRFEGDTLGLLEINWLTPSKERTLSVLCERGMFVADYQAQSLCFYENHDAVVREGALASVSEGPMTRYPIANREPLKAELEAVRDAILSGGPPPVSAEDGIAALRVVEALVTSSQTGAPVALAAAAGSR